MITGLLMPRSALTGRHGVPGAFRKGVGSGMLKKLLGNLPGIILRICKGTYSCEGWHCKVDILHVNSYNHLPIQKV